MKHIIISFIIFFSIDSYGSNSMRYDGFKREVSDTIIKDTDCTPRVPKSVGPDKENFEIIAKCPLKDFHIEIFNRWGQKIFEADKLKYTNLIDWDYSELSMGVYVYTLKYQLLNTKEDVEMTGYINVIE